MLEGHQRRIVTPLRARGLGDQQMRRGLAGQHEGRLSEQRHRLVRSLAFTQGIAAAHGDFARHPAKHMLRLAQQLFRLLPLARFRRLKRPLAQRFERFHVHMNTELKPQNINRK